MDRLFRFFAIAECRVHDASSLQVRSQATVSCSQPEYSGLLKSCQTVDWVCTGVVVSSGSCPLTFLSVSEQGFDFLVSEGGHGLQLFAPRLSQAICSFISWNPTMGRDPRRTTVHLWGRSCRSFSSWRIGWSGVLEIRRPPRERQTRGSSSSFPSYKSLGFTN